MLLRNLQKRNLLRYMKDAFMLVSIFVICLNAVCNFLNLCVKSEREGRRGSDGAGKMRESHPFLSLSFSSGLLYAKIKRVMLKQFMFVLKWKHAIKNTKYLFTGATPDAFSSKIVLLHHKRTEFIPLFLYLWLTYQIKPYASLIANLWISVAIMKHRIRLELTLQLLSKIFTIYGSYLVILFDVYTFIWLILQWRLCMVTIVKYIR